MSSNRVIGRSGTLPWHLPADLRFFKQTTMGHPVIMGRRTYDSVGRPLPGRTNIVISRDPALQRDGVSVVGSLAEALQKAEDTDEVFVVGGAEIYRQALPLATRIYLTLIHVELEGDTFFPELDETKWKLVSRDDHPADEKNRWDLSFLIYERG